MSNILNELNCEDIIATVQQAFDGFHVVVDMPLGGQIRQTEASLEDAYDLIEEIVVKNYPNSEFAQKRAKRMEYNLDSVLRWERSSKVRINLGGYEKSVYPISPSDFPRDGYVVAWAATRQVADHIVQRLNAPSPYPETPAPVPAEDPSRFAEQLESALGITPFKTACAAAEHLFSRHPLPYSSKYSLTKKNVEIFDAKERLVASVEDHDSLIHPRVIVDILNGIGYLTKPSKDDKLAKLGAALLDVLEQARMVSV